MYRFIFLLLLLFCEEQTENTKIYKKQNQIKYSSLYSLSRELLYSQEGFTSHNNLIHIL